MFNVKKKDIPTHTLSFNLECHTYFSDTTTTFAALFWIPKQSSSQKKPKPQTPKEPKPFHNKILLSSHKLYIFLTVDIFKFNFIKLNSDLQLSFKNN